MMENGQCLLSRGDSFCVMGASLGSVRTDNEANPRASNEDGLSILSFNEVPKDFHEPGIISGYRCAKSSIWLCIISLFRLHNETINIWTQFIPTVYFFLEFLRCLYQYTNPFMVIYLGTAVLYLLTSTCAHTFNCMSLRARHICFFFDYVGLTLYSCGCAISYYAFALPNELIVPLSYFGIVICDVYLFLSVFISVWSTHMSCTTRFWKPSLYRKIIRLSAFVTIWAYLAVPLVWRIISCYSTTLKNERDECASVDYWLLHFLSCILAGFLYVSHLPERKFPGMFDIFGHSHQVFHVFGALATLNQYKALQVDLLHRKSHLQRLLHMPSVPLSMFCITVVFVLNFLIVHAFYKRLQTTEQKKN